MIHLDHISKTFNAGTAIEVIALKDIDLNIQDGEFVIIVGANGSGKSSLLNILAGSTQTSSGNITIDNTDITHLKEHERSQWITRIFQNPVLGTAADLSILDNFRLASLRTKKKKLVIGTDAKFRREVKDRIAQLQLGLEDKLDQLVGTLSGGQRQALTLLMSTMDSAKVLLLDEPAAALDPRTSKLLMDLANQLIHELKLTAILVTHQLKDVLLYGDRVIQLQEGKILRNLEKNEKKALKFNDLVNWFEN